MADIKPSGINLVTGQYNSIQASDTLRPAEGDLTISSGTTQLDGTVLTLRAGDGNLTIDSEGGSVFVVGGLGNDNAIGGHIELTAGDSGAITGDGGHIFLVAGDSVTSGDGGDIEISSGAASSGTPGAITILTQGGIISNVLNNGSFQVGTSSVAADNMLRIEDNNSVIINTGSNGAIDLTAFGSTGSVNILAPGISIQSTFNNVFIESQSNNVSLSAVSGTVRIAVLTTQNLSFYGAGGTPQQAGIADPTGGGTVDTEARAAIVSLITVLETLGLIATV